VDGGEVAHSQIIYIISTKSKLNLGMKKRQRTEVLAPFTTSVLGPGAAQMKSSSLGKLTILRTQ
jgi:hypothetical protein